MFLRREPARPSAGRLQERLKQVVRETLDRPSGRLTTDGDPAREPDVMTLLVELRAAGRRGRQPAAVGRLGPEFSRFLGEFYSLPAELQPPAIEALLNSKKQEDEGDLPGAVRTCEAALLVCPDYAPLLDRLARLESAHGQTGAAERWYTRLLDRLDRLGLQPHALAICRRLLEGGASDADLLERCGLCLEAGGDVALAARCWAVLAAKLRAGDGPSDALPLLDRALTLQPESAELYLQLGLVYEQLGEDERAAVAFDRAEALVADDPAAASELLLIRARVGRPDEAALGRLMDLLEAQPEARGAALRRCEEAVADSPYNPHLRFLQGVLLAHAGQLEPGIAALRTAAEGYSAQSDHASELEARLALRQLARSDENNPRRIAELYFERGEVRLAMQALAELAQLKLRDR